jgi:RIO kinase 2
MAVSADDIRSLHRFEVRILSALEQMMRWYDWVPLDLLVRRVGLAGHEVSYRLGQLIGKDMVRYNAVPYEGYALVFGGYDTLALRALVKKGTIQALGPLIGEGKESVVYDALGFGPLVLKLHRVGQRAFRSARLNREYMPETGHCPWLYASKLSAEREFEALSRLHPAVSVPVPVDLNRHVVAMSRIEGATLPSCELEDPGGVLDTILANVQESWIIGIVHADLSEFNVMYDGTAPYLIDWPQWMEREHPNAEAVLAKDIGNVLRYFRRRYGIGYGQDDALRFVTG